MRSTSKSTPTLLIWSSKIDALDEWSNEFMPRFTSKLMTGKDPKHFVLSYAVVDQLIAINTIPLVAPIAPPRNLFAQGAAGTANFEAAMVQHREVNQDWIMKNKELTRIFNAHTNASGDLLSIFGSCTAQAMLMSKITEHIRLASNPIVSFRALYDSLRAQYSPTSRTDSIGFRTELAALKDSSMSFTSFHTRFNMLVDKIRSCNDLPTDLDLAAFLVTDAIKNPAFAAYKATLISNYAQNSLVYNWTNFLDACKTAAELDPTTDNFHQTFAPAQPKNIYSTSSRGIPSSEYATRLNCNRCGNKGHRASSCFARFCTICHERLDTGIFHNITDPKSCNPDLKQEVYGLGITPGSRGSTPFSPPTFLPPRPSNRPPPPPPRGYGRQHANARLRQPPHPSPQQRHAANSATSTHASTSPPVSEPSTWTDHDDTQYEAFMAEQHDIFLASREEQINSDQFLPEADDEDAFTAPLTGVKRGHDEN